MPPQPEDNKITVHLDRLLAERQMTLTELAARVDVTPVNLSILKNGRARPFGSPPLVRCAKRWAAVQETCSAMGDQMGGLPGVVRLAS